MFDHIPSAPSPTPVIPAAEPQDNLALFVGVGGSASRAEQVARRGGFEVLRVASAAAAEGALAERPADVIVLDGQSAGYIDFSACRRLSALRSSPIMVIADGDDETDRVLALELGADDCASPECGDRELLARVRALARRGARIRPQPVGGNVMTFAGMRLDPLKRELRRLDGRRIALSRADFELLQLFLKNAGRVVSRNDILQACRGDRSLDMRNVPVRIYRLRRRLNAEANGLDLIRTVHSIGYILDVPVALS